MAVETGDVPVGAPANWTISAVDVSFMGGNPPGVHLPLTSDVFLIFNSLRDCVNGEVA